MPLDYGSMTMAKQWFFVRQTSDNGAPAKWVSSRHDLQVVADCGLFRVARDGRYLRSPKGRVRSFTTLAGAQAEADVIARTGASR